MELLFPLLILLLFIPIFLSGRRQRRQMKEMQEMQASLEAGDVVMTTSGLRGTIVDASYEDTLDIEIADGVVTTWVRGAVREKVATPADEVATPDETTALDGTTALDDAPTAGTEAPKTSSLEKDDSSNGTPRS